ncbi:hypothetical protein ACOMHN_037306 [Nucella lapillus]
MGTCRGMEWAFKERREAERGNGDMQGMEWAFKERREAERGNGDMQGDAVGLQRKERGRTGDLPLSKFEFVHYCLKLDQDLTFELVSREQVTRPFIRTVDDDAQMLYFPREYIKTDDEAVSRESLDLLLTSFYQAGQRLREQATQRDVQRPPLQAFSQTVKAVCAVLAKIETITVTKALDRLQRVLAQMASPGSHASQMMGDRHPSSADPETLDAINVAVHCSLLEDLQEAVDQVVAAVQQLVRMYCQTYHTDFSLGPSVLIPHNQTEVTAVQDGLIVHIATAHRLPGAGHNLYEEFQVVCSLYHGTHRLHADIVTSRQKLTTSGLCDRVVWDEWLQFDVSLSRLPREMRLCLTLVGVRYTAGGDRTSNTSSSSTSTAAGQSADSTPPRPHIISPIGAAAIQLYNQRGHLLQGSQLVPLTMGVAADPTMPACKTLLPDSILLQVNLPEFDKTIYFPPVVNTVKMPSHSFDQLTPEIQTMIRDIMEKDYIATLSAEEMETVWQYRHYLHHLPTALPRVLQAKGHHGWEWSTLADLRSLLSLWPPLHPTQAFEVLLPQYPDLGVREFAAESLARIPADDLAHFLPQLIQALKFESYHNSPLARLLLETSCKSVRFAHQFFWLLKGVAGQDASYKRRYELMFVALASVAGDTLYQEFRKQEDLVKVMTSVAEKVKVAKDKDGCLKRELQGIYEFIEDKGRLLLPYNPSLEVSGVDMKSCSYFTSNAFPLKLVFKNSNPRADPIYVMYKVGDDLRQDMLTLQVIRIMDMLWLQEGLDLKILTFSCLPTGPKRGVVELITEAETLRKIQALSGVTGSFRDRAISHWLQTHNPTQLEYNKVTALHAPHCTHHTARTALTAPHNPTQLEYNKAVENFMYSCAGYCVATYVLGVGDRHNDNIMLKQSGHMFHIDFSKFLGDAQMFGNIKRDRVPFVLTPDMVCVINDGGRQGGRFQQFIDLCCQAFNILRTHADLFRNLFMLSEGSGGCSQREGGGHNTPCSQRGGGAAVRGKRRLVRGKWGLQSEGRGGCSQKGGGAAVRREVGMQSEGRGTTIHPAVRGKVGLQSEGRGGCSQREGGPQYTLQSEGRWGCSQREGGAAVRGKVGLQSEGRWGCSQREEEASQREVGAAVRGKGDHNTPCSQREGGAAVRGKGGLQSEGRGTTIHPAVRGKVGLQSEGRGGCSQREGGPQYTLQSEGRWGCSQREGGAAVRGKVGLQSEGRWGCSQREGGAAVRRKVGLQSEGRGGCSQREGGAAVRRKVGLQSEGRWGCSQREGGAAVRGKVGLQSEGRWGCSQREGGAAVRGKVGLQSEGRWGCSQREGGAAVRGKVGLQSEGRWGCSQREGGAAVRGKVGLQSEGRWGCSQKEGGAAVRGKGGLQSEGRWGCSQKEGGAAVRGKGGLQSEGRWGCSQREGGAAVRRKVGLQSEGRGGCSQREGGAAVRRKMSRSGIPGVTEQAVMYVQRALLPGNTKAQASAAFTRLMEDSRGSLSTQFNFFIHNLAQLKFSSHSEGALLTFVPKTYSLQTDGRITAVQVHRLQKRYQPDKHYVYILRVDREGQRVPTYVFRLFAEFVEFRDKLSGLFPLVTWSNFSTRLVLGRSNIRTVAESRKVEIEHFLKELWVMATEISECDLVYTFFHPLLRDEQAAAEDKTNLNVSKLREISPVPVAPPSGNTGIQGEIKLSVQYKHDTLHIMVMHIRDLARSAELPSPYVKTYLLPDPDKQTKRKTKIVKNTVHPTFNEVLQYRMREGEVRHRTLQVCVWDHDVLKENTFLGAVYLRLRHLNLAHDQPQWHTLQPLQVTGSGALA